MGLVNIISGVLISIDDVWSQDWKQRFLPGPFGEIQEPLI